MPQKPLDDYSFLEHIKIRFKFGRYLKNFDYSNSCGAMTNSKQQQKLVQQANLGHFYSILYLYDTFEVRTKVNRVSYNNLQTII